MPRIVNKNPNASTLNNGIEFKKRGDVMVSVGPVEGDALAIFLACPGFEVLEDAPVNPVAFSSPEALGLSDKAQGVEREGGNVVNVVIEGVAATISEPAPGAESTSPAGDSPSAGDAATAGAEQGAATPAVDPAAEKDQEAAKPAAKAKASAKPKAAE